MDQTCLPARALTSPSPRHTATTHTHLPPPCAYSTRDSQLATVVGVAVARQTVRGLRVFGYPCNCKSASNKQGGRAGTHARTAGGRPSCRPCTGSVQVCTPSHSSATELVLGGTIGSQRANEHFTWSHPIACMVIKSQRLNFS